MQVHLEVTIPKITEKEKAETKSSPPTTPTYKATTPRYKATTPTYKATTEKAETKSSPPIPTLNKATKSSKKNENSQRRTRHEKYIAPKIMEDAAGQVTGRGRHDHIFNR